MYTGFLFRAKLGQDAPWEGSQTAVHVLASIHKTCGILLRALLDTQGAGTRHPDAMKLDRGLTPLLLAAYIPVRSEEHDRRLRQIMKTLLERGALITQREEFSGATVMHLLASKPLRCSVIHRIRFLLNVLEDHRNAEARVPGLMFDPVLNGAPVDGGTIGGMFSIAVHLLGMRCYQGKLPEEVAPPGRRQTDLRRERRLLPLGLRDTGYEDTSAGFN